ncbi:MAG: hypothetical protein K2G13_04530, partial [Muribaculaceae bacterium]|nr:hypothetical protein [Muribaculaceae bacterium]
MSRIAIVRFVFIVLSLALAGGCADDLRNRNIFDSGAGDVMMSFSVENISMTRADGDRDIENVIDHAYLLFYDKDVLSERAVPLAAVRAEISEKNPNSLSFKMPLRLEPDTDYKLVAIANADNYVPEGYSGFSDYLQAWGSNTSEPKEDLLFHYAGRILACDVENLPMRGKVKNDALFRFSMQNGVYSVSTSLSFRRAVARIDVANTIKEGFRVEGVALCNWRDAASSLSEEGELGNCFGRVCGILTDSDEDSSDDIFVDMPTADNDGIQKLKEAIYCFPSLTYESYPSDNESTALIIKAKYKDDTDPSYYR